MATGFTKAGLHIRAPLVLKLEVISALSQRPKSRTQSIEALISDFPFVPSNLVHATWHSFVLSSFASKLSFAHARIHTGTQSET